jgi:hypothetical protein
MRMRTTFLWSMIISLAFAAALGIIAILWEGLGETGLRVLVTSLLIAAFSLVCLACAVVLARRRAARIMWIGIGASLASLAIWLGCVWFEDYSWPDYVEDAAWKSGLTATVICLWAAHLGLLVLPPIHRRAWQHIRTVTLALAALLGSIIIVMAWPECDSEIMVEKVLPILTILVSCGTVVTPVLALIDKIQRKGEPTTVHRRMLVTVVCPRCDKQQQITTGRGRCAECGLRMHLDIEEPRCECGYLLYQLEGDRCPECGRPIPASQRWRGLAPRPSGMQPNDEPADSDDSPA